MPPKAKHDWTQFLLKVNINAAPARVFRAWTMSSELNKWFTYSGSIDPHKGGTFRQVFIDGTTFDSEVLEIRKGSLLRFTFGKVEKVEVKIRKSGKGAECWLKQYDMKTGPNDKWNMHMGCRIGWTFFLANLKAYLEHGVDLRSRDSKKTWKEHYINS
ncbi:MAG: SRPBCC domain-containing protein [bacterium]